MTNTLKYSAAIALPPWFQAPVGNFHLRYTTHARNAASSDRFDDLWSLLPATIDTTNARLCEVASVGTRKWKMVYRIRLHSTLDAALVVIPNKRHWRVLSVWGIRHTDNHQTLNKKMYVANIRTAA